MVKAIPEAITHRRALEEFDSYLRRDKAEQVDVWEKQYADWDAKPTGSPCLFDIKESCKCRCRVTHGMTSYTILDSHFHGCCQAAACRRRGAQNWL